MRTVMFGAALALVSATCAQALVGGLFSFDQDRPLLVQNRGAKSPLKLRDPPPPTLRPTLASKNPQGDGTVVMCRATDNLNDTALDRAIPSLCSASVLDVLSLDFGALLGSVSISLTSPDGRQSKYSTPSCANPFGNDCDQNYDIYMRPGVALGTYTFVATSALNPYRTLKGGYTVVAQTKPILRMRLLRPSDAVQPWLSFAPGAAVTVDLAGYRALGTANLYLYRGIRGRMNESVAGGLPEAVFEYAAALGEVQFDLRGEASFAIPTQPDDPLTDYMVVSDPHQQGNQWDWNARFTLGRH